MVTRRLRGSQAGKAKNMGKEKDAGAKRAATRATGGVKSVGFADQDDDESDDAQHSDRP